MSKEVSLSNSGSANIVLGNFLMLLLVVLLSTLILVLLSIHHAHDRLSKTGSTTCTISSNISANSIGFRMLLTWTLSFLHKYQVANLLTNLLCQSSQCGEGKKCPFSFCRETSYLKERYLPAIGLVSSIFAFPLQHMSHSIEMLSVHKHGLPNIVF